MPLVVVENVHILPGVPVLFERMINSQKDRLRQEKVGSCPALERTKVKRPRIQHTSKRSVVPQVLTLRQVFTRTLESDMADVLATAQQQYPAVEIGCMARCYPVSVVSIARLVFA